MIDLDVYDGKPVFDILELVLKTVIDPNRFSDNTLNLRANYINSHDGHLVSSLLKHNYSFYEVLSMIKNT